MFAGGVRGERLCRREEGRGIVFTRTVWEGQAEDGSADVHTVGLRICMWTHCVSAVQFFQKGVVCAFGEATLLIDKSQHAQFLKKRKGTKAHRD